MLRGTIRAAVGPAYPVVVIVNHLRSLSGINGNTSDAERVRAKRRAQAEDLAKLIQGFQTADPAAQIISVGDYNAFQFNDGYVDGIATVKGTPTSADQVTDASPDLVDPDLIDVIDTVPAGQRYSFMFDGNAQEIDHVLITQNLSARFVELEYARNNADFAEIYRNDPNRPERLSDQLASAWPRSTMAHSKTSWHTSSFHTSPRLPSSGAVALPFFQALKAAYISCSCAGEGRSRFPGMLRWRNRYLGILTPVGFCRRHRRYL